MKTKFYNFFTIAVGGVFGALATANVIVDGMMSCTCYTLLFHSSLISNCWWVVYRKKAFKPFGWLQYYQLFDVKPFLCFLTSILLYTDESAYFRCKKIVVRAFPEQTHMLVLVPGVYLTLWTAVMSAFNVIMV